jgi:hypothetical protein
LGFDSWAYTTQVYFPEPYDNDIDAEGVVDKVDEGGVLTDFDAIALKDDLITLADLDATGAEFSDLAGNILTLNNDPLADGYFDTTLNIMLPRVFQATESMERILLQAGDADQDKDFDQFDLIRVQQSAKYLTGQAATWGEGDWNGVPGGSPGDPPAGNGQFDQLDVIAAQQPALYLTGPYATIQPNGQSGDGQTSVAIAVKRCIHTKTPTKRRQVSALQSGRLVLPDLRVDFQWRRQRSRCTSQRFSDEPKRLP